MISVLIGTVERNKLTYALIWRKYCDSVHSSNTSTILLMWASSYLIVQIMFKHSSRLSALQEVLNWIEGWRTRFWVTWDYTTEESWSRPQLTCVLRNSVPSYLSGSSIQSVLWHEKCFVKFAFEYTGWCRNPLTLDATCWTSTFKWHLRHSVYCVVRYLATNISVEVAASIFK